MGLWAFKKLQPISPEQRRIMLRNEFGGINESFYNLYAITGKKEFQWLAEFFYHNETIDPLKEGKDVLDPKHANTFIPKLLGLARNYEIEGKGDADIRQDFPGGWKGDSNNAFTNSGRTEMQKKFFDFTKKVLNWRKNKEVIHTGKLMHYIPENNVYVYFRYNDKESVMVVINNDVNKHQIKNSHFGENLKNYNSGIDVISGRKIDLKQDILIEGKSSLILELK